MFFLFDRFHGPLSVDLSSTRKMMINTKCPPVDLFLGNHLKNDSQKLFNKVFVGNARCLIFFCFLFCLKHCTHTVNTCGNECTYFLFYFFTFMQNRTKPNQSGRGHVTSARFPQRIEFTLRSMANMPKDANSGRMRIYFKNETGIRMKKVIEFFSPV